MKRLIFLALIFIVSPLFSQTHKLSPNEIKSQKDSLLAKKSELLNQKEQLNNEIGELTKEFVSIDKDKTDICRGYYLRKYGEKLGNQIANRQIWKGMTEQMLIDSWGTPDKKNTNKEKWGTFTQYYYGKTTYFFKDGKLTDWEEK